MSLVHDAGFTAHNVRLDDGSYTFPAAAPIEQMGDYQCFKSFLPLLFPEGWAGRSVVDLGCLEGGYATEFARLGLEATGIDVRASNIANAQYIKSKTDLPNLRFVCDDAWNVGAYGPFDLVFCVGLHYHIEDQRRFLHEMSRACRKAIFIDTHVAPEFDHEPAVEIHKLSPLDRHEGLPGRWYPEHELDAGSAREELEALKWSSWENRRSFWPTRGGLVHAMRRAGFSIVVEAYGQWMDGSVQMLAADGWGYRNQRSMFVGVKTDASAEAAEFDTPDHALDGALGQIEDLRAAAEQARAASEQEKQALHLEVARLRSAGERAEQERAALDAALAEVRRSTSWKLTAPLRAVGGLFRR